MKFEANNELQKEYDFFNKDIFLSYSGINKLLFTPKSFYKYYILQQRDDTETKDTLDGKLIHCLLLEPDKFEERYIISSHDVPTDSNKKIIDKIYQIFKEERFENPESRVELVEFYQEIIELLKEDNLYQNLVDEKKADANGVIKTGDDKRVEKILNDKNLAYWYFLVTSVGKKVIDQETYDYANHMVEEMKKSSFIMNDILGFDVDNFNQKEVYSEYLFELKLINKIFGLHGAIDRLNIDHQKKEINISDIKKTTNINAFQKSIDYYNYWLQAAIYTYVIGSTFGKKYPDYHITFRFVIIDAYEQFGSQKVSDETMLSWIKLMTSTLQKVEYHLINKNFSLPYEYLINKELTI